MRNNELPQFVVIHRARR